MERLLKGLIGGAKAPPAAKPGVGAVSTGSASDWIKDGSVESFYDDVITASIKVPVLVDFWATWCGPCKTLGPALEKIVSEAKGAIRLVKIDVDRNPELAQQMRIQSVPAVYAFKNGQPVDGFMGALPESQIKAFIERLLGDALPVDDGIEGLLAEAKALADAGDATAALDLYREALSVEAQNTAALAGYVRALLALRELKEAEQVLSTMPPDLLAHAEIAAARTALDVAKQAAKAAGSTGRLEKVVAANPDDHQARFDLALAYFADGDRQDAVEALLELFRRDRAWNEDAARKQLVKFFEAFGMGDPLTIQSRKRLSSLMFS
jgi:putative thioredoxin